MIKRLLLIFIFIILGLVVYFSIPLGTKFFLKGSTRRVISGLPYYVDKSGWTLVLNGKTEGQRSLSFEKDQLDTFKHIIFIIDENNDAIRVVHFSKKFTDDHKDYFIRMNSKRTLYSYYFDRITGDSVFQTGEYFYNYTNLKLSQDEFKYYLLYKDSLNLIKGDNLPRLPAMNESERRRFNESIGNR